MFSIKMYSLLNMSALVCASAATAAPFCNGNSHLAGGKALDTELPGKISPTAIKELRLAYFLELLEVSFFNVGLQNLTQWDSKGMKDTIETIEKISAQEEVHLESLSHILDFYNATLPLPCSYSFPVTSSGELVHVARLLTSTGIGATIGLQDRIAATDPELVKTLSSILTVEARHEAILRHVREASPFPTPFDTGISDIWAYNLAHNFIRPGTCPVDLPLPLLPKLAISDTPKSMNKTRTTSVQFNWDASQTPFVAEAGKELLVGWVSQLNEPAYTPLTLMSKGEGTAEVPVGLNGTVFAVITAQTPLNVDDLALASMAGPVILILD